MRFVITGKWRENGLLRLIIIWFLVYVLFFWVTNLLLFLAHYGFSYHSVVRAYLGSKEDFLQPRSYLGLLETSHFHLFAMAILVLTLAHLLLFVPLPKPAKAAAIWASFSFALADEASGWLIRFVSPLFAYLKLLAFSGLQLTLFFLIAAVAWALFYDDSVRPPLGELEGTGTDARRKV